MLQVHQKPSLHKLCISSWPYLLAWLRRNRWRRRQWSGKAWWLWRSVRVLGVVDQTFSMSRWMLDSFQKIFCTSGFLSHFVSGQDGNSPVRVRTTARTAVQKYRWDAPKFWGTAQMNKHECKSKKRFWRKVVFRLTIGVSGIDFLRHHLDDKGPVASGWGRIQLLFTGTVILQFGCDFWSCRFRIVPICFCQLRFCYLGMDQNLSYYNACDEHPLASYFGVHQGRM